MKVLLFSLSRHRIGELFMGGEILLWSAFPVVSILAYDFFSPLYTAALVTGISGIVFGTALTLTRSWHELKRTDAWADLLIFSLLIGVIVYALFFYGMRSTTAANVALVSLTEVFFSFVILGLWGKERVTPVRILGAICMCLGAGMVITKGDIHTINRGDIFIMLAMAVAPIGNHFNQRSREKVSTPTLMFVRSVLSTLFLLGLFFLLEGDIPSWQNHVQGGIYVLIIGILCMGLAKIFFTEAIHRIPITEAISLTTARPFFTMLYAWILLKELPTSWQIMGAIPLVMGTLLLLRPWKKQTQ